VSLTTTVKFDSTNDGVYEIDATSKVIGGPAVALGPGAGTCSLTLNNSAGTYSPRGAGTPIRPLMGVQVISESQNSYHGFVRRVFQDPRMPGTLTVECNDWMWVLGRIDVSAPMMREVASDILAHRIADLAEVNEHVDNPRFKDDLAGWSNLGAAVGARVTSGHIMEGLAAQDVTGLTGIATGVRYSLPHTADSDFQSKKLSIAAYVWSEDGADVGEVVTLRLADSVGTIADQEVTLSAIPQRVTVSGTFNGAATDFYIEVRGAATNGAEAVRIGAAHAVFFSNAIPRSFAVPGSSVFEYVAPRRRNAGEALRNCAMNELGGIIYVDESGNLTFDTRTHRWIQSASLTSQATIDETMVDLRLEENAEDLIGEVEIGYTKWEVGAPGSTVFELFPVPVSIGPSATKVIPIDYGALVRDHIIPVANTDYFIRSSPDGDGAGSDESGNVTMTFQDFGEGAQVTFVNTVARTVHLTSLAIRGTPVRVSSDTAQVAYTPGGAPVIASKLTYRYDWLSRETAAQSYAEYLGDRYVTQRERIPVTLLNRTAALQTQQTTRKIGDRVTITNDNADRSTKLNGDYYIDSIRQEFAFGAMSLRTVWDCSPVDAYFWRLGTGELGDAQTLSTTTALAP